MFPLQLVDCSWMSLYIPKLDATCVLTAKAINHANVLHIRQVHGTMESCVAACYGLLPSCNLIKYSPFAKVCNLYYENATRHILQSNDRIGQSMHLLLHSCHKDISNIPAGIIVQSAYLRNNSATIHTPSTHKNCDIYGLPFVENFYGQRIQLIATSSLEHCIAFCTAPTYTSCNSVLFSSQEGTCLFLSRARTLPLLGGIIPTLQTSALFFVISRCYNDFVLPNEYTIPRFEEIAPTVYTVFNLSISVYHADFYATEAGMRLRLWHTAEESQCLMICLDKFLADFCDAYYFSYREKTCLTFRIRKIYALPNSTVNRQIIRFSDLCSIKPEEHEAVKIFFVADGMLIKIVKDQRLPSIKHSNHITTEAKVSLFQFKEICTVQHSVSTVIPCIKLAQLYANVSFLNECISICRFIRNFGLCEGIAYSKETEACLTAVLGNHDDEVYLNEGYHFLTLNNCSKDRENERADNDPPELHVFPILDEVCQLEFYKPLFLTGWSVIIEIPNTTTLQECLTNCAAVMQANKCSAIYFIDDSCFLLERKTQLQNYFIRERASVFAELLFCEPNIR
ncbi:putative PAN domain protein [Trichinella spiralis]|uniref:putative PAN domain protein n=1 Tax=Trichinella spiralis TaxID=6334 RepID=UPI0001EFE772|nr:putative PAN domain protein [Trichinella spiralis]